MPRYLRRAVPIAAALVLLVAGGAMAYDGTVLYEPDPATNADDRASYEHAIRLKNSGDANGTVLATFERQATTSTDPAPGWLIYRSSDGGKTFDRLAHVKPHLSGATFALQPNLLELSRPAGDLPAGTLLLAGQTGAGGTLAQELFQSTDHGATWQYVTDIVTYTGGPNRPWEPFLIQLDDGRIVDYHAEEVQPGPTYQQNIVRRISTDGGRTWGEKAGAWVSDNSVDRPGMPTVTRMGDGRYAMAVELCGGGAPGDYCRTRVKFSDNGLDWGSGPADMGIRPLARNGAHPLHGNPFVTWSPAGGPNGTLILSGRDLMRDLAHPDDRAGGHGQTLLVNYEYGAGEWYELIAPIPWIEGGYQSGYRNAALPSEDGRDLTYFAASYTGQGDRNRIVHGTSNAGVLPYAGPFDGGTDAGWKTFGGQWSVGEGVYTDTAGGAGDKAVAGSTYWSDYTLEGDVRLDGAGNAGFLVRTSDPWAGADAHRGHYVGLSSQDGGVFLGRQNFDWRLSSGVHPMPGGVRQGAWYHVSVRVTGCAFTVSAQEIGGPDPPTSFEHTDAECFARGQIGVRTWNTPAAWRNVRVTAVTQR